MGKKILLTIASIFLAYQSYKLTGLTEGIKPESWLLNLLLGWIFNMMVTGVFAFMVFAWPAQKMLPSSFYKIRHPKWLKKIYKTIKVDWFRKFLLATFWKSQKQRNKHFNGKADGIDNLDLQSRKSEFGHILPFVILILFGAYFLSIGSWKLGISILLWNVFGNLYPVILQRHHRMRIQILRKRYGRA